MVHLNWLPLIDQQRCNGCAACVQACPTGALGLRQQRAALIHPGLCSYCLACEDLCPTGAIQLPLLIGFAAPESDQSSKGERDEKH